MYLGVCEPVGQVLQQVVPGVLAEASDAVSRLPVIVPNNVLLAHSIVSLLPLPMQLLIAGGGLGALHLVCVVNIGWPVVDLLILLQRVQSASLKIGLQT